MDIICYFDRLAATKENSLKKRDFMLVHLDKTWLHLLNVRCFSSKYSILTLPFSSDLKDYIMHERNRPRLSLYLSSQLLYGAIKVYSRQIKYLLGYNLSDFPQICLNLKYFSIFNQGDTMELFMRIRFQPSVVLNIQDVAPRFLYIHLEKVKL